jgi:coenzyme F420 biosynthesis associated uncharacterized protein
VIDWSLATRIAGGVAGDPPHRSRPALAEKAARSEQLVSGYTGLVAPGPLPEAELIGREAWVQANVRSMRPMLDPITDRLGEGLGPLGPAMRTGTGLVVAAEVGVLLGLVGRRVLGQYELVLLDAASPARLLFVGPNLDDASRSLGVDDDEFLSWVALHEVTHALQFAGVPWLRAHLSSLVKEVMGSLEVSVDPSRLLRVPTRDDLRTLADAVIAGDLLQLVTRPEQRLLLDRVQATMAVLEGYAEHVMDAAGAQLLPSLPKLRSAMTSRRSSQTGVARLLGRLLGLEMKMRQYELGKRFCDAVVADDGIAGLNRVWDSPEALPTLAELENPALWRARTPVPSVTKS